MLSCVAEFGRETLDQVRQRREFASVHNDLGEKKVWSLTMSTPFMVGIKIETIVSNLICGKTIYFQEKREHELCPYNFIKMLL
jgi:hypothetical protein